MVEQICYDQVNGVGLVKGEETHFKLLNWRIKWQREGLNNEVKRIIIFGVKT